MIYKRVTLDSFIEEFKKLGQYDSLDGSTEAAEMLFDYLDDAGTDVELDSIALCCEFSIVSRAELEDYDIENPDEDDRIITRSKNGNYYLIR